jgi:hypothetical protein
MLCSKRVARGTNYYSLILDVSKTNWLTVLKFSLPPNERRTSKNQKPKASLHWFFWDVTWNWSNAIEKVYRASHVAWSYSESKFNLTTVQSGDRGSVVDKVMCYKSEGRWFDPSWCHWIFHWHKIHWHQLALGSTQPLTEMTTRSIS